MSLVSKTATSSITFDRVAIMRRAYHHARFALELCRVRREGAAERNRILSRSLSKAWAEAKGEADHLRRVAETMAAVQASLAARAAESVALASRYGHDADAIRAEIEGEHYRQHMNFAAVDRLQAALATVSGARS